MTKSDFARERQEMIESQLRARGISDPRVLAAFARVPREAFVPEAYRDDAYGDHPVPIGEGQTVSQPYMVALMIQELKLPDPVDESRCRVLEIGTGSGYQTALLVEMGCEVYTVERIPTLSRKAQERLAALGYREHIHYRVGDGTLGWPEEAPFERITVGAGAPRVPPSLAAQLADGGVMVIPVGDELQQELVVVERCGGKITQRPVCGCVFVRLIGREGW